MQVLCSCTGAARVHPGRDSCPMATTTTTTRFDEVMAAHAVTVRMLRARWRNLVEDIDQVLAEAICEAIAHGHTFGSEMERHLNARAKDAARAEARWVAGRQAAAGRNVATALLGWKADPTRRVAPVFVPDAVEDQFTRVDDRLTAAALLAAAGSAPSCAHRWVSGSSLTGHERRCFRHWRTQAQITINETEAGHAA